MSESVPEPQPAEPQPPAEPTEPPAETPPSPEVPSPEGEPAPEEPAQPEPETEPPQAQGPTQAEWEARFNKAEKAFANYTKRVTEIWEEDATSLVPLTFSPSAPPGFLSGYDAGRIPDEAKKSLLSFLGITQEVEYERNDNYQRCDACKGKGQVATGSLVANQEHVMCPTCSGRGYIQPNAQTSDGPTPLAAVPPPPPASPEPVAPKDEDDWGHPRLLPNGMPNPNFGKMPQYVDPQFP